MVIVRMIGLFKWPTRQWSRKVGHSYLVRY